MINKLHTATGLRRKDHPPRPLSGCIEGNAPGKQALCGIFIHKKAGDHLGRTHTGYKKMRLLVLGCLLGAGALAAGGIDYRSSYAISDEELKEAVESLPSSYLFNVTSHEAWTYNPQDNFDSTALRYVLAKCLLDSDPVLQRKHSQGDLLLIDLLPYYEDISGRFGFFLSAAQGAVVSGAFGGPEALHSSMLLASHDLRSPLYQASSSASFSSAPHVQLRYAQLGVSYPGVPFLNLIREDSVSLHLRVLGEWECLQTTLLQGLLPAGAFAVDVGAHLGTQAIALGLKAGREGKVVAFEAQPGVHAVLEKNAQIAASRYGANIQAVNAAVGVGGKGKEGKEERPMMAVRRLDLGAIEIDSLDDVLRTNFGGLSLVGCETRGLSTETHADSVSGSQSLSHECMRASTEDEGTATHDWVDVVALDSYGWFNDPSVTCPTLIKIDVEGMESSVLAGAAQTLRICVPIIHVENNLESASPALIKTLSELGYDLFWDTSTFAGPRNYYGSMMPSAAEQAGKKLPVYISVNLLSLPPGFDRSRVSPEVRLMLSYLTPVDPKLPLLSSYNPVHVLDHLVSQIDISPTTLGDSTGFFYSVGHGRVEMSNFFMQQLD